MPPAAVSTGSPGNEIGAPSLPGSASNSSSLDSATKKLQKNFRFSKKLLWEDIFSFPFDRAISLMSLRAS